MMSCGRRCSPKFSAMWISIVSGNLVPLLCGLQGVVPICIVMWTTAYQELKKNFRPFLDFSCLSLFHALERHLWPKEGPRSLQAAWDRQEQTPAGICLFHSFSPLTVVAERVVVPIVRATVPSARGTTKNACQSKTGIDISLSWKWVWYHISWKTKLYQYQVGRDTKRIEERETTAERIFLATEAAFAGLCSFKGVGEQRFNHHVGRQILIALAPSSITSLWYFESLRLAWHNNIMKQNYKKVKKRWQYGKVLCD